jgi:HSP20 family molecular chaperone IbpA
LADFDTLVQRAFGPFPSPGFTPAAELHRDGEDALVRVELPGLDPAKDVSVEVEQGTLVVRGERRDERAETRDGRSYREVRYGSFRRAFALPAHVTADAISASYDAGVLSIRVAGAYAGTQAQRIEVTGPTTDATPAVESGE